MPGKGAGCEGRVPETNAGNQGGLEEEVSNKA
jgi:hypothetical protein